PALMTQLSLREIDRNGPMQLDSGNEARQSPVVRSERLRKVRDQRRLALQPRSLRLTRRARAEHPVRGQSIERTARLQRDLAFSPSACCTCTKVIGFTARRRICRGGTRYFNNRTTRTSGVREVPESPDVVLVRFLSTPP